MNNSVLELMLVNSLTISPNANVIFDDQRLYPAGIDYDNTTGIITFKESGQYSIKWWVATETALRGTMGFRLRTAQGITPGCSPIKTGQVTGFGVMDVEKTGATLALENMATSNTVISKKAGAKAYLLITPIGQSSSSSRVYRADLSTPGSYLEVLLADSMYYRLEYASPTQLLLALVPYDEPVLYDYRRFSAYTGSAVEGTQTDNTILYNRNVTDSSIYNSSQEMHWVLLRLRNPKTDLWSLYELRLFASAGTSRVTVWVNTIEEDVTYG